MLGLRENLIHLFETAAGGLGKQEIDERYYANVEPSEDDEVTPSDHLECSRSDFGDQNGKRPECADADTIDGRTQVRGRDLCGIEERDPSESKGMTKMKEKCEDNSSVHGEFIFGLRPQAAYQCHADSISRSAGQHQTPTPKSLNSQNAHNTTNWAD